MNLFSLYIHETFGKTSLYKKSFMVDQYKSVFVPLDRSPFRVSF